MIQNDPKTRHNVGTPTLMWSIENNLSLGNMDFGDFAAAATAGYTTKSALDG